MPREMLREAIGSPTLAPPMTGSTRSLAMFVVGCTLAGCASDDLELGETTSNIDVTKFVLPPASAAARAAIVHEYDALDPTNKIPRGLLEDAIAYFDLNATRIPKLDYFVVIDFSKYSGTNRYWLVDVSTGSVEPHKVAHGDGSDPDNDGYANSFGNVEGSHKSSLGFYLTGEIYDGTHIHSMRLDGLSADGSPNGMANTNARPRLIVMHEASYVSETNTSQQGRSNGCPALDPDIEVEMVDRIFGGSLIYAATSPLNAPVGRGVCGDGMCHGDEDHASCAADCMEGEGPADDPYPDDIDPDTDDPETGEGGGCSTTGGNAGLLLAFAALVPRRRRRP